MKNITLKEAYAQAAKRPLRIHPSDGEKIVQSSQGVAVMSGMFRESIERRTNAALLCHSFNTLPSVVAALEAATKYAGHPCKLPGQDLRISFQIPVEIYEAMKAALALANTVKIPGQAQRTD